MKRDDSVYLSHILDSISQLEEYTRGLNKEEFLAKRLVQDGTIRQIEIIVEATKKYSGVDIDAVWEVVKKDTPILKHETLMN